MRNEAAMRARQCEESEERAAEELGRGKLGKR